MFMNYFQGLGIMFTPGLGAYYLDWFYSYNTCLVLGVFFFVAFSTLYILMVSDFSSYFKDYSFAEFLCGVVPVFLLLTQMFPSIFLLYFYGLMNFNSDLTLKIMGNQWYWSYFYSDIDGLEFDSFMKTLDTLDLGEFRLLDVDARCIIPCNVNIRFLISSNDVIHSWTLFNYFIKVDAIGGVLNSLNYSFPVVGVFYGQCSEICGANHSFMPIVVEVTLFSMFKHWCLMFVD